MISVNKIVYFFLIFLIIPNCSLNKAGFWTENKKIETEEGKIVSELFKDDDAFIKEFNTNVKIQLKSTPLKNSFVNNLENNNGLVTYNGNLENISKFKFSKIDNFNHYEPEILFDDKNVIFFDNKGSIFKFDQFSKLIWKKNYYKKNEKKNKPKLYFGNNKKILVVADNLAKYYAIDIKTGDMLWSKINSAPFNSQVKIYEEKIFVVDFENVLRCYSIKDGSELWNVKTETTFIKSQKKLSLVVKDNKVIFSNSIGDISAVNANNGNLIWQTPTQSSAIYESAFLLKTSDLVVSNNSIFFSNNKNQFFSINLNTGILNWQQKVNSIVRPTVIDKLVFTISLEGFLILIDKDSGNIIRITNIFDRIKKNKKKNIEPSGFVVGTKNIYVTTNNGFLIVIDSYTGKSKSLIKIDGDKISRPFILNKNLFIIKDNSIIKLS